MAVSVKLDDALKRRVQHLATSQRRSAHWIMREAIRHYVEREEAREGSRQEALASWAEYKQSGQHLTGGETRDWRRSGGRLCASVPRVVVTAGALRGLERCRHFFVPRDRRAAARAGTAIERQLLLLEDAPEMGRRLRISRSYVSW